MSFINLPFWSSWFFKKFPLGVHSCSPHGSPENMLWTVTISVLMDFQKKSLEIYDCTSHRNSEEVFWKSTIVAFIIHQKIPNKSTILTLVVRHKISFESPWLYPWWIFSFPLWAQISLEIPRLYLWWIFRFPLCAQKVLQEMFCKKSTIVALMVL